VTGADYRDDLIQHLAYREAAALDHVRVVTGERDLAIAERDLAIAERDASNLWLRASLHCNIELTRKNARIEEYNRRERQQHADLREEILHKGEAA
jgi:hypothetical protein